MDYSERRISVVEILDLSTSTEGRNSIRATVRVQISGLDGGDYGPEIKAQVVIDRQDAATLADVERQLLAAAIGVLARLAGETAEFFRCS